MATQSPAASRLRPAALLGALLLLAAAALAAPLQVLDGQGRPVAGAQVQALAPLRGSDVLSRLMPPLFNLETGADGGIDARLPRLDGLLLIVDHPGFAPWVREIPGGLLPGPVRLSPGESLHGEVSAPGKTAFQGEACVSWTEDLSRWGKKHPWRRCAALTPAGGIGIAGLPGGGGVLALEVEAAGYLPLQKEVRTGQPLHLRLEPGVLLRGRVRGPAGPVAKARVRGPAGRGVETRTDGGFELAVRALPAPLTVEAAGFHPETLNVAKPPGPRGLPIRLRPAEQLVAKVVGDEGRPIQEAELRLQQHMDDGSLRWDDQPLRSPTGELRIDLPGPGAYRLAVRARGYREARLDEVTVAPGQAYALGVIALTRGSRATGKVVDRRDGHPLAGAQIELLPMGTQMLEDLRNGVLAREVTGDDGGFVLSGITSGRYEMRVRLEGFATGLYRFSLDSDRAEDVGTIALDPGTTLRGRIVDRAGKPRPALTVRVFDPEQSSLAPLAERTTDQDGVFRGPALAAGRYRVQILGSRLFLSEEVDVSPGGGDLAFDRVAGGVQLHGIVTRGGEPVPGGFVSLSQALDPGQFRGKLLLRTPDSDRPEGYGLPESLMTADLGPQGTFDVADAPPGLLWASITTDDGASRTRRLLVPDQAEASVNLEIGGLSLQGRVEEAGSGEGVTAAAVQVTDPSGRRLAQVESGPDGAFAVPGLETGTYNLEARAEGYVTAVLSARELSADSAPVRIPLERGDPGQLTVRLHRPDGTPISGMPATLLDASGAMVRSLPTDAAGERRFEGLPAGLYFLVWTDALAGTGVSEPIQLDGKRPATLEKVLGEGTPVALTCDPQQCGGAAVDLLGVYSTAGIEIGPYLSGMTSGLRFSQAGGISLGRLAPGRYLVRLWVHGARSERPLTVGSEPVDLGM
jgi:5-hydroxyisourate hydrolase-like protein (transthyretin family)